MIQSTRNQSRRSIESRLNEDFPLEYHRFRYLGYLSYRDLFWAGITSVGGVGVVIGLLPMTDLTITFLVVLLVIALGLMTIGSVLWRCQRVMVYRAGSLYIARDEKTGMVRHGRTALEALENLRIAINIVKEDL